MKRLLIAGLAAAQVGCAGMGAVMEYRGTPKQDFTYEKVDYRIFDRRADGKVMITPSVGNSALHGMAHGATFGGVKIDNDESRFAAVAQAYLAVDRPECKVVSGELLMMPQWEFVYTC
jgi:hypothetical protein